MLTEKNFSAALKAMNFVECGNFFEKTFADGVTMSVDIKAKKLFYPAQIQGRDRNDSYDKSRRENLVVFECVNRLLDKGYNPEDIELERQWQLGHTPKGGRADICVSSGGKVLFIVECKTFGDEFNHEIDNMLADGGQLFSYWQQEQSCRWLMLYASDFADNALTFNARCVSCDPKFYGEADTVPERFKIWSERFDKFFFDDVIFHAETVAYKIGVRPLRKRYLHDIKDSDENQSVVNQFEEILRHNQVSDKENAFNRLTALFICKVVDEARTSDDGEVSFQFKFGADTRETFQDRLQKLYADGMKKFMGEDIFYLPEDYPDKLFKNFADDENHDKQIQDLRENFRRLKFFTNNEFAFVEVSNEKLFRLNSKILVEVVRMFQDYRIIGSRELQLLGDLFEQLLSKGFKQDEGQFFTPTPIAQFIWDSLPLDEIVARLKEPPKVIDYACGAGHFLTEGFKAVNDCFARNNLTLPVLWERDKIFGVEKDYRLARVSKVSLFMHGAGEGKIKFGDGLENYPDENISPATFDVLVANPPYSVKGFKAHLKLANEFDVLDKISNSGSEIETLFAERISQLVKPKGVAAVILPSSILNKDGKSFVAARESLLRNFYVRAIVKFGSKTFGETPTSTVVMFLERFDEPPRVTAEFEDIAETILSGKTLQRQITREVFDAYTERIGVAPDDYKKFITRAVDFDNRDVPYFSYYADNKFKPVTAKNLSDDERRERNNQKFYDEFIADEREKIIYFALTFRQTTLIVTAPDDNKEEKSFLGYKWSNRRGNEGREDINRGGLLFDNDNRLAENKIAAVIRAAFRGEQVNLPALEKYFHYATLADMLNFDAVKFTKTINTVPLRNTEAKFGMTIYKLGSADFNVSIGNRVLSTEIVDDGEVPVYSANVFEEFGRINKRNITDFSKPSVIWGIDGDWMVNFVPANVPFYPTDHCGVLRVNTEKIIPEYLAFALRVEGEHENFSRAKRASIERIKSLRVQIPTLDVQKKIVDDFKALDAQIDSCEQTIHSLDADIQKKFNALFVDKNFPTAKLGDVCNVARGGSPRPISDYITEDADGINWIKIGDADESRYITKTAQRIKPEGKSKSRFVKAGDFLLSNSMTFGKPYILKIDGCIHDGWLVLDYDKSLLEENYFHAYLSSPPVYKMMAGLASGSVVSNLNSEVIKKLPVVLPPLELQKEFASYVSTCEAMKQSARSRRDELIHARGELVTKYFR